MTLLILIAIFATIASFAKASPLGLEDNLQWEKFKLQVFIVVSELEVFLATYFYSMRKFTH